VAHWVTLGTGGAMWAKAVQQQVGLRRTKLVPPAWLVEQSRTPTGGESDQALTRTAA